VRACVRAEQGSKKPRIQRLQLYMYDHRDVELKNQVMEVTLIKNFLRRKQVAGTADEPARPALPLPSTSVERDQECVVDSPSYRQAGGSRWLICSRHRILALGCA
jgi:hypothetical protein